MAKLTIHVVGHEPGKIGPIRDAVRRHFGDRDLPAYTLIDVQGLARPEVQIEADALAIKRLEEAP